MLSRFAASCSARVRAVSASRAGRTNLRRSGRARVQSQSSTVPTSASVRSVARSLKHGRRRRGPPASVAARRSTPRTPGTSHACASSGIASTWSIALRAARPPSWRRTRGGPGKPSALSPTSASQSGIDSGGDAELRRARRRRRAGSRLRRSSCTTLPPTHCPRSLSGVQMITCSTRAIGGRDPRRARRARRRLRSSTIAHTATPSASRASSSSGNCASSTGSMPVARLVVVPEIVAERLDDVIGGDAEVRRAAFEHARTSSVDHAAGRPDLDAVAVAMARAAARGTAGRARRCRRRGAPASPQPGTRTVGCDEGHPD